MPAIPLTTITQALSALQAVKACDTKDRLPYAVWLGAMYAEIDLRLALSELSIKVPVEQRDEELAAAHQVVMTRAAEVS